MRNLIFAALLLSATSVWAAEPETPDDFNAIFAMTCMKHFYSQDDLRKAMDEQGAEVLAGDQAEFFLGGQPGSAWILTVPSTKYVVSLRKGTLCAVFAQRAKSEAVQRGFASLVSSAPEPLVARKLEGPALGPTNGSTKTSTYS